MAEPNWEHTYSWVVLWFRGQLMLLPHKTDIVLTYKLFSPSRNLHRFLVIPETKWIKLSFEQRRKVGKFARCIEVFYSWKIKKTNFKSVCQNFAAQATGFWMNCCVCLREGINVKKRNIKGKKRKNCLNACERALHWWCHSCSAKSYRAKKNQEEIDQAEIQQILF